MIKRILERGGKFIEGNRLSGIIVAIIAFVLVFLLSLSEGYDRFDLNLYDLSFTIKPRISEWDRLVFIDIDDNTTNTLGQYPLPRRLYGQALRALKEAGVSQYTMDIMFFDSSPLQVPGDEYEKLMEKMEKKNVIDSDEIRQSIMNNDQIFADGVSSMGRVILAYNLSTEPRYRRSWRRRKRNPSWRRRSAFSTWARRRSGRRSMKNTRVWWTKRPTAYPIPSRSSWQRRAISASSTGILISTGPCARSAWCSSLTVGFFSTWP
jgi:hypothetical protein